MPKRHAEAFLPAVDLPPAGLGCADQQFTFVHASHTCSHGRAPWSDTGSCHSGNRGAFVAASGRCVVEDSRKMQGRAGRDEETRRLDLTSFADYAAARLVVLGAWLKVEARLRSPAPAAAGRV